jgi:hypothetical protein
VLKAGKSNPPQRKMASTSATMWRESTQPYGVVYRAMGYKRDVASLSCAGARFASAGRRIVSGGLSHLWAIGAASTFILFYVRPLYCALLPDDLLTAEWACLALEYYRINRKRVPPINMYPFENIFFFCTPPAV